MNHDNKYIQIQGVEQTFKTNKGLFPALRDIDLDIAKGEFVALIGHSGCGKSTLLNLIAGFEQPSQGQLLVDGQGVRAPGPDRGVVFQEAALFPWLTVWENVIFGPKVQGMARSEYEDRAHEMIKIVGLSDFKNHLPVQLSGGMRQRVGIARILTLGSRVLLMDEPCSALDPTSTRRIEQTIRELVEEVTIVIVTHNMQQAQRVSHRCAFFLAAENEPGRIIEEGPTKDIFTNPRDSRTNDYVNGRFG